MTNWTTVFWFEFKRQVSRRAYLLVTFGLPILAIVGFFVINQISPSDEESSLELLEETSPTGETEDGTISTSGFVDHSGLFTLPDASNLNSAACQANVSSPEELTPTIIKQTNAPVCFTPYLRQYPTLEAGKEALRDGKVSSLFLIREDYLSSGEVAQYIEELDFGDTPAPNIFENYLLSTLLQNVPPEAFEVLYLRLRTPAIFNEIRVSETGATQENINQGQNFALVYGFSIIMMLGIFWGGGYLMQGIIQDKENRIVEIVLSSVRPTPLLFGKIMANGLAALVQVLMFTAVGLFLIQEGGNLIDALDGVDVRVMSLVGMFVYFVLGFLLYGSLMAGIGALSPTMREAQGLLVFVTLPVIVPLLFQSVIAEEPASSLAVFMSIFPLFSPLGMIMRLAISDVPASELALSLGLLLLTVIGSVWFSGRLFRVNTLLMGNLPRLRDIPKLLRG
jgi:ABC-2 type transport system permease protein